MVVSGPLLVWCTLTPAAAAAAVPVEAAGWGPFVRVGALVACG